MLGGDLSKIKAPVVGIRFEHILYNFGKPNQPGRAFVEDLMFNRECNVYLFTCLPERKAKAWCLKWNVPYTEVFGAETVYELVDLAVAHELMAYYDTDDRVLEAVSSRGKQQTATTKWEQTYESS
jgi:hypothetical protein